MNIITIKEAILQSLENLKKPSTSGEIYHHIIDHDYYKFGGKTPASTVAAESGYFIRNGDSRVKRIKRSDGTFLYYLTKQENEIGIENLTGLTKTLVAETSSKEPFKERDLHILFSTFLKGENVLSKTIFHEHSLSKNDRHQKWIHPDMIGVRFIKHSSSTSQSFLKAVNRKDTFVINSYELKKQINTDYELKESFFQAVSNSSWANHGYLVTFSFNESLKEEMKRLNQSFGIGILKIEAYPHETKVIFPAKRNELDFSTIDKLCIINSDFNQFIAQVQKLITADEVYFNAIEKELETICDKTLKTDTEIKKYCEEKHIPFEVKEETDTDSI